MRPILLIIFCTIGFTASAQFWHRKPKRVPQEERFPLLEEVKSPSPIIVTTIVNNHDQDIHDLQLPRSIYLLGVTEETMLAEAKHNMRFRIYNLASYNFSDLAAFYILQNRFSEAKWYLLQSNAISRQEDDTKHTLSNLLSLADIKAKIGEPALAQLDLQEAREIASAKGTQTDLAEIDKKIKYLQTNKIAVAKADIHYADEVEIANSKTATN